MTHVDLSPRSAEFLRELLEAGRFGSETEVVEEALRLMAEREAETADDLLGLDVDYVRAKVQESLDDPRPSVPAEEVFARLREKLRHLKAAGGA